MIVAEAARSSSMTTSTPAVLANIDWQLKTDAVHTYFADKAAQQALRERGPALAHAVVEALRALPGVTVEIPEQAFSRKIKLCYRGIQYTWDVEVYRSHKGERYAPQWSVQINKTSRWVWQTCATYMHSFYGQDGRDANPAKVAADIKVWLDTFHDTTLAEVKRDSDLKARQTHAEKVSTEACKVEARDERGFTVTVGVMDAEKLAKLQAFLATL